jgi:hypothetical protein
MQVKLETAFRLAVISYFEDDPAKMYLFSLRPEAITYIRYIYYRRSLARIRRAPNTSGDTRELF